MKIMLSIGGILLLIFDGRTASSAVQEAVTLCLYTVLPSLFPFLVISYVLNSLLLGRKFSVLTPLCRLCGIPSGGESLLLLGLIGGYPVGAQAIAEARRNDSISLPMYKRLLGFCNNAGPSFIFGLVATHFTSKTIPWVIWIIHMLSAIVVGIILPQVGDDSCQIRSNASITLPQALASAIKVMAKICGWVILFRVLITYLNGVLNILPTEGNVLLSGFLELTNGCVNLSSITSEAHRFIIAVSMLSFGGLCVLMQTKSVCEGLGTGMYFPGKALQTIISLMLSVIAVPILFSQALSMADTVLITSAIAIFMIVIYSVKKWWQFRQKSYII